ncbi:iron-containing alcohol dehydrogenase [Candidatus Pelagibacter bacterium nBUS_27]|uniref:iron-containing alcohol dehydrogenase n=1 Tax=Candidatus Pelagibacter bacterium nBUS_27 TaxID=3374188 RepID=UPI003EB762AA
MGNSKKKIVKNFKKKNFIFTSGKIEPTYDSLRNNLAKVKKMKFDLIVGVGGGSCMDTAKAIAVLIKNKGDPIIYRGFNKIKKKGVPTICVPTTAGTGSEATCNASFVDKKTNYKMGINGKYMFPTISILDGETTLSCPKLAIVGAATDALVHIFEAYTSKKNNKFTDIVSEIGFKYIIKSILDLKNKKGNLNKRLDLLKGAYLGGIAVMKSSGGVASSVSYPLSVFYGVPHGIGGGIFLLYVAKYNCSKKYDKYKYLAKHTKLNKKINSIELINYLEKIFERLDVPKKLNNFGINKKDYKKLVLIMKKQQKGFDQNPVQFSVNNEFKKMIKIFI